MAMSELELTISRTIAAPRDQVFNAWLSPASLAKFMRTADGIHIKTAETDPVKGGRFSIVMAVGDKEIRHVGTYLEVDPYSRLAFTWASPFSADDSIVTIDLDEVDKATTEITLKQVKFVSVEMRDRHKTVWAKIVDELALVLASLAAKGSGGRGRAHSLPSSAWSG
jgi:uncharacterized protein YndB with AHSA1/START domain